MTATAQPEDQHPEGRAPLRDLPRARPVAARRTLHEGMIFSLLRDTVDFAERVRFEREYLRHSGAVAVLALDRTDRVLMIRQYRHPVGHELWEIPAGLLDLEGEAPEVGALRELTEETGYTVGDGGDASALRVLTDLRPSPGGSDEVIRVYLATDPVIAAEDGYVREHEEAELEPVWVPLGEAVEAVLAGRLTNATAAAALLALHALGDRDVAAALRPADAPFPERPGRDAPAAH